MMCFRKKTKISPHLVIRSCLSFRYLMLEIVMQQTNSERKQKWWARSARKKWIKAANPRPCCVIFWRGELVEGGVKDREAVDSKDAGMRSGAARMNSEFLISLISEIFFQVAPLGFFVSILKVSSGCICEKR